MVRSVIRSVIPINKGTETHNERLQRDFTSRNLECRGTAAVREKHHITACVNHPNNVYDSYGDVLLSYCVPDSNLL